MTNLQEQTKRLSFEQARDEFYIAYHFMLGAPSSDAPPFEHISMEAREWRQLGSFEVLTHLIKRMNVEYAKNKSAFSHPQTDRDHSMQQAIDFFRLVSTYPFLHQGYEVAA